jgi:hypothetical protein
MNCTPRLALPFISPGQAQKELMHNEALQRLDVLVAAAVVELPRSSPPAAPDVGDCYIIADGATGDWAGQDGCLAAYSSGGWRTVAPLEGMVVYVRSHGVFASYREIGWSVGATYCSSVVVDGRQVLGAAGPPIAAPAGGVTADTEARASIVQILAVMRAHGIIKS